MEKIPNMFLCSGCGALVMNATERPRLYRTLAYLWRLTGGYVIQARVETNITDFVEFKRKNSSRFR